MTFTEIYELALPYVVSILPSLAAIIGIIASIIKVLKDNRKAIQPVIDQFNALRQEVKDKTEMNEIKSTVNNLLEENAKLRKDVAALITAMNKVQYNESSNKKI